MKRLTIRKHKHKSKYGGKPFFTYSIGRSSKGRVHCGSWAEAKKIRNKLKRKR